MRLFLVIALLCLSELIAEVRFPSENAGPATQPASRIQIVRTREFLHISEIDPFPRGVIEWAPDAGEKLYLTSDTQPHILLFGKIKKGHQFSFNGRNIRTKFGNKFKFKFSIPLKSTIIPIEINFPSGETKIYRLLTDWVKNPERFSFKVREGKKVTKKALGFSGDFEKSVFVQLYSNNLPVDSIDLDSADHAKITFRIEHSLDESFEGWSFTIVDESERIVSEIRRVGSLPRYIDWQELEEDILVKGNFYYWVSLFKGGEVFRGPKSKFSTTEGMSLRFHRYHPFFLMEPQADIGHFSYSDADQNKYSGMFLGIDLAFTFWNLFFIRGYTANTIHTLDEGNLFTFIRVGGGLRLYGSGENDILGNPHFYQVNVSLNHSGYTISPQGEQLKRGSPSLLLETPAVLWAHQYIVPWVEYGAVSTMNIRRISLGAKYFFLVRPWSVKIGLGFAYHKFYAYKDQPDKLFSILNFMMSFYFFV